MAEAEVIVNHEVGLHARPAAAFVRKAASYPCTITVRKLNGENRAVNAKSILSVLTLGVNQGDRIAILTEGAQSEEALRALVELVESNFGE